MAGIAYKEEVLSYGTDSEITLNFSGTLEDSSELSWCQIIYLKSSVLVCKVFSSSLVLDQLFFTYPDDCEDSIQSIEKSKRMRIRLQGQIVPSLIVSMDDVSFSIFSATSLGFVYKLTFNQDVGFTDASNIKESGGYILENMQPCSFALVSITENDYEFCMGLENGSLCFATFPSALTGEYIFPSRTSEVKIKSNLINSLKDFVFRRQHIEKTLRIANIKNFQLVTLSSFGVIRLHNSEKRTCLAELDLETGKIEESKFSFVNFENVSYLTVGLPHFSFWSVWVLVVQDCRVEVLSKFTETGLLVDLAVDMKGVWSAWVDDKRGKVTFFPFKPEDSGVFTRSDQILIDSLEDFNIEYTSDVKKILQRLLIPGRFPKSLVDNVLGREGLEHDALDAEYLNVFKIKRIMHQVKRDNWNYSEIQAICCNEERGFFPPVVVRKGNILGFLRPVLNSVQRKSLTLQKEALAWNPLAKVAFSDSLALFRQGCKLTGLEKCLLLVHIWRQNLEINSENSLARTLDMVSRSNIPESLKSLLKKSIPSKLKAEILTIFQEFESFSSVNQKKNLEKVSYCDTFLTQSLFASALNGSVRDLLSYFIDFSLFLLLCETSLADSLFEPMSKSLINKSLTITNYLLVLNKILSTKVQKDAESSLKSIQSCLESFSYPFTVSNLFFISRSNLFYSSIDIFAIEHLNEWICNVLSRATRDLLVFSKEMKPQNYCLMEVLAKHGQTSCIKTWMKLLGERTLACWYFKGQSLLSQGKNQKAQKVLTRAVTDLLSGNHQVNYNNLLNSPVHLEKHKTSVFCNQGFNMFNYLVSKTLNCQQSKAILLFDFVLSSLSPDFTEDAIQKYSEKLAKLESFEESYMILQSLKNKKIQKKILRFFIEKAVVLGVFYKILNLPLSSDHKTLVFNYLIKKSRDEHFDIFAILTHKDHVDDTRDLFINILSPSDRGKNVSNTWSYSLYSFSMRQGQFSLAAEASYKLTKEIEDFLKISENLSRSEKVFILELFENNLLLTLLAMRNIDTDLSRCFIRVFDKNHQKKDGTIYEIMKIVALDELEKKFQSLDAMYSQIDCKN